MAEEVDPAEPPADLVALYRNFMLNRQADWMELLTGRWGDPREEIDLTCRKIREHPYWKTLLSPAAVSGAARELRLLGVHDPDGGPPIRPVRPVDLEEPDPFGHVPSDQRVLSELARELDEAGLWDGLNLTLAERRAERLFVEQGGNVLRFGLFSRERSFEADPVHMYEVGALSLLDDMAPGLAAVGLALDVVVISDPYRPPPPGGEDYILQINGLHCPVWTRGESEKARQPLRCESLLRPLIVINELLEEAGPPDRLYVAAGGNLVHLLPQKVSDVLTKDDYKIYNSESLVLADRSTWFSAQER